MLHANCVLGAEVSPSVLASAGKMLVYGMGGDLLLVEVAGNAIIEEVWVYWADRGALGELDTCHTLRLLVQPFLRLGTPQVRLGVRTHGHHPRAGNGKGRGGHSGPPTPRPRGTGEGWEN